jgi:hypothetical protein
MFDVLDVSFAPQDVIYFPLIEIRIKFKRLNNPYTVLLIWGNSGSSLTGARSLSVARIEVLKQKLCTFIVTPGELASSLV